jgi:hypothetical protein
MNMHIQSWEAFLFAAVDGETNSRSVERLLTLVSNTAGRKGISKILIDGRRLTGTLSTAEREALGVRIADLANKLPAKPAVAFVGHPPSFNGLAMATARNRGVNIKLFDSTDEGIAWLRRQHVRGNGK